MDMANNWARRIFLVAAGLIAAVGVMAAAGASHGDQSRNLAAIATICLAHGPALLALGLMGRGRVLMTAGLVLALGTAMFAGDLAMREWLGRALFAGAAPIGGGAMILGWLGIALGGVLGRRNIS